MDRIIMNPTYKRNEPLFFKEKPSCDHPIADAEFIRDMGICQGEPVCEIRWKGSLWIVRYSEVKTKEVAIAELREKWTGEIETAKKSVLPKTTKVAIAAALGISTATLRKRMKFLEGV